MAATVLQDRHESPGRHVHREVTQGHRSAAPQQHRGKAQTKREPCRSGIWDADGVLAGGAVWAVCDKGGWF